MAVVHYRVKLATDRDWVEDPNIFPRYYYTYDDGRGVNRDFWLNSYHGAVKDAIEMAKAKRKAVTVNGVALKRETWSVKGGEVVHTLHYDRYPFARVEKNGRLTAPRE